MNLETFSYNYYHLLKNNTIITFIDSNLIYEQWEQLLNMLHDFRKDIDYITFSSNVTYRIKNKVWRSMKYIVKQYLIHKYSCNPLESRDAKITTKELLIKYLEDYPNFGYQRGEEIMRYIPYSERRRRNRSNPPPPPPIFVAANIPSANPTPPVTITPPTIAPPPAPSPAPPPVSISNQIVNPFTPNREIPRTPNNNTLQGRGRIMSSSLSLFRR